MVLTTTRIVPFFQAAYNAWLPQKHNLTRAIYKLYFKTTWQVLRSLKIFAVTVKLYEIKIRKYIFHVDVAWAPMTNLNLMNRFCEIFFFYLKSLLFSFKCVWWISYWWVLYCNVFKWSLIFKRTEDSEKYIIHGKLILILHPNYQRKSTKTEIHTDPPIILNILIMLVFLSKHLMTTMQWWYVLIKMLVLN